MPDVRTSRGISLEVWNARPYIRWETDNLEPIEKAYEGLTKGQVSFMKMLARQQGGWIINRHAVPHAPRVWPEIRPDDLVRTGPPTLHWHGAGDPPELPDGADWFPDGGYRELPRGSKAWNEHCNKINDTDLEPDTEHERRQDPHEHANRAKYCFPPAAKVDDPWAHDHSARQYQDEGALRRHLENYHTEPPKTREDGKHVHTLRLKSTDNLARRLDVHPMAEERWGRAERIYFGIEGCLKADSILSAIRREDRPESVFSVPSVSLWAAEEFDDFLPHLWGKTVVVVPDADWFAKPQVLRHARFAQRYLQHRGVEASVAAPPLASGHKGVDDYLGAGGSLDGLEVLDREPPELIPAAIEYRHDKVRADGLENMRRMIYDLSHFADAEGYVYATQRTMAKIIGMSRKAVVNNLQRMRLFAWIEIEQLAGDEWLPPDAIKMSEGYVSGGVYFHGPEEFAHKTRIRVHEELRSKDLDPHPLGPPPPGDLGKAKLKVTNGRR